MTSVLWIRPICAVTGGSKRLYSTNTQTIGDQIIESIKKLSAVKISQPAPNGFKDSTKASQGEPRRLVDLSDVDVKGRLDLLALDKQLSQRLELSVINPKSSEYLREVRNIGSLVLGGIVPMYLSLMSTSHGCNPEDSKSLRRIKDELSRLPVGSNNDLNLQLKGHHIVGINWLQNPYECLKSVLSCIKDIRNDPLEIPNDLTLLGPLELPKHLCFEVDCRYLYYNESEFQLPSVKQTSPELQKLLVNSSIVPKEYKDVKRALESFAMLGNAIYKSLVRRAILNRGSENYLHLYYVFTGDNYLQFLLENIPIYNGVFPKSIINSLTKVNANDLYYRQFGQYFAVIFLANPKAIQSWVDKHVGNYIDIFNNLSEQELNEFLKSFKIFLNSQLTQIDLFRLTRMDKAARNIKVTHQEVFNPEMLLEITKDYLSFVCYKFGMIENLQMFNKQKSLILSTVENPVHKQLLLSMGSYIQQHPSSEYQRFFVHFVSNIAGKPYKQFRPHNLELSKLPVGDVSIDPLITLALVNFNVSKSYFRHLSIENPLKLSDYLKKLSLIGYSYYRFIVNQQLYGSVSNETVLKLKQVFLLKVFKTYVMDNSNLLRAPPLRDNDYNRYLMARMENKYLLLKFGQVGFDQLIGAMVLLNPDKVNSWIREILVHLVNGNLVNVGTDTITIPPLPIHQTAQNQPQTTSKPLDLSYADVFVDKLDNCLQLYYRTSTTKVA